MLCGVEMEIKTINDFIKKDEHEIVTIKERAYELFNDEKFFKGDERSHGEVILRRLGLSYEDLKYGIPCLK